MKIDLDSQLYMLRDAVFTALLALSQIYSTPNQKLAIDSFLNFFQQHKPQEMHQDQNHPPNNSILEQPAHSAQQATHLQPIYPKTVASALSPQPRNVSESNPRDLIPNTGSYIESTIPLQEMPAEGFASENVSKCADSDWEVDC